MLLLVPTEVYLELEVWYQDIFSPGAKSMKYGTQEGEERTDATDIETQYLGLGHIPSTLQELPHPRLNPEAEFTCHWTLFSTQG